MAIFRRKTTTEIPELQEYYATRRPASGVMSWLLALLSLIITAAVILGLFFGGRWLWRKFKSNKDKVVTTTQNTGERIEHGLDSGFSGSSSSTSDGSTDSNSSSENTSSENSAAVSGSSTGQTGSNSNGSTNNTSNGQGQIGASGVSTSVPNNPNVVNSATLTNTGPGETVAVAFIGATLVGYVVSARRQSKNPNTSD